MATPQRGSRRGDLLLMHAVQYYIAGRFAAECTFVPVCVLLFHHALEMVLKAEVLERHPHKDDGAAGADLRKRFGHDLNALWAEVKGYYPQGRLSDLDGTVAKLDGFEDVRYPLATILTLSGFSIRNLGDPPLSLPDSVKGRQVFISLEEVDALMTRVWRVFGLPLDLLRWSFIEEASPLVQAFYTMDNRLPAYPPQVVVSYRQYKVDEFPHPPDLAR